HDPGRNFSEAERQWAHIAAGCKPRARNRRIELLLRLWARCVVDPESRARAPPSFASHPGLRRRDGARLDALGRWILPSIEPRTRRAWVDPVVRHRRAVLGEMPADVVQDVSKRVADL